ncbi:MAG: acetoacetate decarboxylase [Gammaproteobacteria bacterium]|jgi:acetoacetate decarboxylase
MKQQDEGYSMPLSAPTFTAPPFAATQNSRILYMIFTADPDALSFEVPEPLEVDPSGHVLAWIGDMGQPSHTIDLYHEALTAIRVCYGQWSGWYINYIWVDHDMALTMAREIYGWPANLCEPTTVRFHGSQIFGECIRYGEPLMRMSLNVTSPPPAGRSSPLEERFAELAGGDFLQIRKFPPVQGGKAIKQLLLIPSQDFQIHEIYSGNGVLEFGKSGLYPELHKLAPQTMLGAWYLKASWVVPEPQLLWEA